MVDGLYQISQCWLTALERSVHFYNVSVSHSTHIAGIGSLRRAGRRQEVFQAKVMGLEVHWGIGSHQLLSRTNLGFRVVAFILELSID